MNPRATSCAACLSPAGTWSLQRQTRPSSQSRGHCGMGRREGHQLRGLSTAAERSLARAALAWLAEGTMTAGGASAETKLDLGPVCSAPTAAPGSTSPRSSKWGKTGAAEAAAGGELGREPRFLLWLSHNNETNGERALLGHVHHASCHASILPKGSSTALQGWQTYSY